MKVALKIDTLLTLEASVSSLDLDLHDLAPGKPDGIDLLSGSVSTSVAVVLHGWVAKITFGSPVEAGTYGFLFALSYNDAAV